MNDGFDPLHGLKHSKPLFGSDEGLMGHTNDTPAARKRARLRDTTSLTVPSRDASS